MMVIRATRAINLYRSRFYKRSVSNNNYNTRTISVNTKAVPIVHLNPDFKRKGSNNNDCFDSVNNTTEDKSIQQELQNELSRVVRPYYESQQPVLIRNFIDPATPAVHLWKDLDYLCDKVGYDTLCFVEIGGSYTDSNTSRNEILFGEYIAYMNLFHEQFGNTGTSTDTDEIVTENGYRPKPEELVYMAQNHLCASLNNDFVMPELVGSLSELKTKKSENNPTSVTNSQNIIGHGHLYSTMMWFGPSYCISPLHYDPLDNLFMGFVGRKKVVLFPKDESDVDDYTRNNSDDKNKEMKWHYGGHNGQQYNTSPVDICDPDLQLYPNFRNAPKALECVLHPGEILFIPKRWWHHVTSLDTAVSVNVWWR